MKTSILERFATDAINAPAAVTGGGGNYCKVSKSKSNNKCKTKSKSQKCKSYSKSRCVLY